MSKKSITTPSTPTTTTPSSASGGPTAPCVGKPKKRGFGLVFGLVGFLVLIIVLATSSPSGCQNTPQRVLGPWKVNESRSVRIKLDSNNKRVSVPTNGERVSFKWENPTEDDNKTLLSWRAHGKFGEDGGDIVTLGFLRPQQFPEDDFFEDVFFYSFILKHGESAELTMKFWEREIITVQP